MRILVINNGSSSIKYKLLNSDGWKVEASGSIERIGEENSKLVHESTEEKIERELKVEDHRAGMAEIERILSDSDVEISAIGHRVVHGGEDFKLPAVIDAEVAESIRRNIPLAPLHNPANLAGIETALELFPEVPQVAVFDTAFHQTIPDRAFRYCLPDEYYSEHGIRRYGFHGTSHLFVGKEAAAHLGRSFDELDLITIHLGNGASIAAIKKGKSLDTSMGMTPLDGLCMGTRCGEIDPAVHFYLADNMDMSLDEINDLMNRESGLKGLCGMNDMREVLESRSAGNRDAALAVDIYTYRVKKYIGTYLAVLGGADAIVFTGGIGWNSPIIRGMCCSGLEFFGIELDADANEKAGSVTCEIQRGNSGMKVLVIPTDEELEIARQALDVLR